MKSKDEIRDFKGERDAIEVERFRIGVVKGGRDAYARPGRSSRFFLVSVVVVHAPASDDLSRDGVKEQRRSKAISVFPACVEIEHAVDRVRCRIEGTLPDALTLQPVVLDEPDNRGLA